MNLRDVNLTLVGTSLSAEAIGEFEVELGGEFDSAYKAFLSSRNGGVCSPAAISPISSFPIQVFFSLEDGFTGLRRMFHDVNEFVPSSKRFLPFADDRGGQSLAIEVGMANSPVYLLIEREEPRLASDSFSQFATGLRQDVVEKRPVEILAQGSWDALQDYLKSHDESTLSGPLSLLSETIRCSNAEFFNALVEHHYGWGDLDDAAEVAMVNGRFEMLKVLVEIGADPAMALELADGPHNVEVRKYLESKIEAVE
ncbi:MAG: SMI1/KNR4 family protein [Planctomycetota bacterium]